MMSVNLDFVKGFPSLNLKNGPSMFPLTTMYASIAATGQRMLPENVAGGSQEYVHSFPKLVSL